MIPISATSQKNNETPSPWSLAYHQNKTKCNKVDLNYIRLCSTTSVILLSKVYFFQSNCTKDLLVSTVKSVQPFTKS